MRIMGGDMGDKNFFEKILNRFKKRDFSGTTGQAIRNSSYQLAQTLIFKFGSLIFRNSGAFALTDS